MSSLIYIFLGGGIGSICRFGISKWVLSNFETKLPIGTLSANVLSCLIMGIALGIYKEQILNSNILKPLLIIGFCGGFSTFSTFSLETLELMKHGDIFWAFANIFVSVILCVSILYLLMK